MRCLLLNNCFCFPPLQRLEMGKKRGGGIPLSQVERRERVVLNETERIRSTTSNAAEYLAWCRQRCRQPGGLEFSTVRAIVWRDLLLLNPTSTNATMSTSWSMLPMSSSPSTVGTTSSDSGRHVAMAPTVPYLNGMSSSGAPPREKNSKPSRQSSGATAVIPPNCHESVLDCDIKRSLWHLFPDDTIRTEKRALVKMLITRCLGHRPELQYYQGLHEVVGFVVYIVGPHLPQETLVGMMDQLLSQHFYLFCHESMKSSESILEGVHVAVTHEHPELGKLLEDLQLGPGTHYALPWLITWFTHQLSETHPDVLARLFDVLLSGTDSAGELAAAAAAAAPTSTTLPTTSPSSSMRELNKHSSVLGLTIPGRHLFTSHTGNDVGNNHQQSNNSIDNSIESFTLSTISPAATTSVTAKSRLKKAIKSVLQAVLIRAPTSPDGTTSTSCSPSSFAAFSTALRDGGGGGNSIGSSSSIGGLSSYHHSQQQSQRSLITPPMMIPRRHSSTMAGLLCVALLTHFADEILDVAEAELAASGGEPTAAFGRVFSSLAKLPEKLAASTDVLEDVVRHAVTMATVPPHTARRELLSRQSHYCKQHSELADVQLYADQELAGLRRYNRSLVSRVPARVVQAAVTTALCVTVASTTFAALATSRPLELFGGW